MKPYVAGKDNGVHLINVEETWQKIQLAARIIVTVDNPQDVIVSPPKPPDPPVRLRAPLRTESRHQVRAAHGRDFDLDEQMDAGYPDEPDHEKVQGAQTADRHRPETRLPGRHRGVLREHPLHRPLQHRLAPPVRRHRHPHEQQEDRVDRDDLLAARQRGHDPQRPAHQMYPHDNLLIFPVQEWDVMPDLFFYREIKPQVQEGEEDDESDDAGEVEEKERNNNIDI